MALSLTFKSACRRLRSRLNPDAEEVLFVLHQSAVEGRWMTSGDIAVELKKNPSGKKDLNWVNRKLKTLEKYGLAEYRSVKTVKCVRREWHSISVPADIAKLELSSTTSKLANTCNTPDTLSHCNGVSTISSVAPQPDVDDLTQYELPDWCSS